MGVFHRSWLSGHWLKQFPQIRLSWGSKGFDGGLKGPTSHTTLEAAMRELPKREAAGIYRDESRILGACLG